MGMPRRIVGRMKRNKSVRKIPIFMINVSAIIFYRNIGFYYKHNIKTLRSFHKCNEIVIIIVKLEIYKTNNSHNSKIIRY